MIKTHWYKILAVLIILYVLIFGMITPLKPGITNITPDQFQSGQTANITISGYNTHYSSSNTYRAYLKFDADHILQAKKVNANSENELVATFEVPEKLPFSAEQGFAGLILDSRKDGVSILPGKVYFEQGESKTISSEVAWMDKPIELIGGDAGYKFPYRNILNETIRNTFFHVAIWFAMFFLMILSLIHSVRYLGSNKFIHDIKAASYAEVAIVFGLIGLATGSIWAKYTWGTFWTSDVKLNMTAIAMLIYCAYWILRGSITDIDNRARVSAAYNIFAFVMLIPLIFVIPRMTDSLHPGNGGNPALGGEDLDNTLRTIFYPAIIGYSMLGYWISSLFIRVKKLKEKIFL